MKRALILAVLFAVSSQAFAWGHISVSHAGASRIAHMKANTVKQYNGRKRFK